MERFERPGVAQAPGRSVFLPVARAAVRTPYWKRRMEVL
jgi:hypothetical protein